MRAPRRSNDQGSARVLSGRLSPANQRPMPVSNSAQLNRLLKEFRALRGDLETMRLELNARDEAIIVVSKGDDELLKLGGCCAWHFPQCEDGVYAGFYPVDSAAAIAHLEELRAKGAGFLLFPATSLWWLDHYVAFRWHLERTCR